MFWMASSLNQMSSPTRIKAPKMSQLTISFFSVKGCVRLPVRRRAEARSGSGILAVLVSVLTRLGAQLLAQRVDRAQLALLLEVPEGPAVARG